MVCVSEGVDYVASVQTKLQTKQGMKWRLVFASLSESTELPGIYITPCSNQHTESSH